MKLNIENFIPSRLRRAPELEFKARVLIHVSLILALTCALVPIALRLVFPDLASENPYTLGYIPIGMVCLLSPVLLRFRGSMALASVPTLAAAFAVLWFATLMNGSIRAPGVALVVLLPVAAQFLGGARLRNLTLITNLLTLALIAYLEVNQQLPRWRSEYDAVDHAKGLFFVYTLLSLFAFAIATAYDKSKSHANERLAQVSRVAGLSIVSDGFAREMRAPIAAIGLRAETLERLVNEGKSKSKEFQDSIHSIQMAAGKLSVVVRAIQSYSRAEKTEAFAVYSLREIIDLSLSLCSQRFLESGVAIRIPEGIDEIFIRCQSRQVIHALLSLYQNSFEAVSSQQEKWMDIVVRPKADTVEIVVSDSGKGLSAETRENLFTPFFTTKEPGKGFGLGLASATSVIAIHGGQIRFEPKAAHTTFIVSLPRAKARPEEADEAIRKAG